MIKYNTAFRASRGKRFAEYIIDCIIRNIFYCILIVLVAFYIIGGKGEITTKDPGFRFLCLTIYPFLTFIYYYVFEYYLGITLGKLFTNTRVVNSSGLEPTSGEIAIRTLCRFIPFEAFSFLGSTNWHDSISNTLVIKNSAPEIILDE